MREFVDTVLVEEYEISRSLECPKCGYEDDYDNDEGRTYCPVDRKKLIVIERNAKEWSERNQIIRELKDRSNVYLASKEDKK